MPAAIAKIAVSAAPYWVDRPFDYLIPEEMREQAVPGVRVSVPFPWETGAARALSLP